MLVADLLKPRAGGAGGTGGKESDVELMRTILGEHVPQSVILTCLNACAFDVSAALNWYFMEVASHAEAAADELGRTGMGQNTEPTNVPFIQSGLSLTLHSRAIPGMVAKTDSYYATLTRGLPSYDMLTPSNDKFLTIRLRKRGWRTGASPHLPGFGAGAQATQRPYFTNGDVVTLECNGLWLRASQLNRVLQWKSPADDDRCKFVVRGLPLGRNLRPGDYFFLTSYKWKDKEVVMKDERPVGISSYNTSMHRCFLGLEKIKTANQRLYLYAKLTENAVKSLQKPTDPIDVNHLTINVMGTPMSSGSVTLRDQLQPRRKASIADEIVQTDAKIDQMANIIGNDVSRDRLANFLDGAGGSVQVALEHYFMSVSAIDTTPPQRPQSVSAAPLPSASVPSSFSAASVDTREGTGRPSSASSLMSRTAIPPATSPVYRDAQSQKPQHQQQLPDPASDIHRPPPRSELILPIPSELPPQVPISAPGRFDSSGAPVDYRSTLVGEPSPGIPTSVASMASVSTPLPLQEAAMTSSTSLLQASPPRPPLSPASVSITEEKIGLSRGVSDAVSTASSDSLQHWQQQQEPQVESLTIQDFEMLSVLGKGSFGAVMLVRFKKDGRVFALKIIKKTNMDRSDVQNAMEERQILQRINHPYICGLVFAFQTNERLYLGMKYYAAGDLFYHLNLKGRLDMRDATLYGAELVLAISYLHKLNILYRDLKPSNIMIDSEGHIGVVDFGLSKQHIYGSSFGVKTLSGTAEYVAPEALAQTADGSRNYGKAYDWWSLGIVLYEMLVGESPFYDENEHTMLSRIAYADVVYPSDFPRDAHELVSGLLVKDPAKRLGSEAMGGVDAIKACRFFRRIDWEKLERRQAKAHWTPKLSSETDTRYVDPEFIDEGPPSAAYDPSANLKPSLSKRFSQFSFNYNLR